LGNRGRQKERKKETATLLPQKSTPAVGRQWQQNKNDPKGMLRYHFFQKFGTSPVKNFYKGSDKINAWGSRGKQKKHTLHGKKSSDIDWGGRGQTMGIIKKGSKQPKYKRGIPPTTKTKKKQQV